jgi:hypothetical protein
LPRHVFNISFDELDESKVHVSGVSMISLLILLGSM